MQLVLYLAVSDHTEHLVERPQQYFYVFAGVEVGFTSTHSVTAANQGVAQELPITTDLFTVHDLAISHDLRAAARGRFDARELMRAVEIRLSAQKLCP